jgi:hypothetical protein
MTMTRFTSVALALSLSFDVGLSAQQLGQSSARASLERDATRMASTLAADVQLEPSDDWDNVRRLKEGTHVRVTTRHGGVVNGRLTTVGEDALEMVVRRGRKQTLLHDDVREVRLGHSFSVGQSAGLGLLLGGITGFLGGSVAACDPHVCGGERGLAIAGGTVYGVLLGGIGGFVVGEAMHARPGQLVYARARP